ncbi:MAG: C40 family peptidase [Kineosporiaceae bacterium]
MTTPTRARCRWLALGAATALAMTATTPAAAMPAPSDPGDPGTSVMGTLDVAELDGRIAAAESRIMAADVVASQAVEDLNAARVTAREARRAAGAAEEASARAERELAGARQALGSLASRAYRQGPDLVAVDLLRSGGGPEDLLDRMTLLRHVAEGQDAHVQHLAAVSVVADVLRDEAEAASDRADVAEAAAGARRADTRARVTAAEQEVERLLAERATLVASLAQARATTVAAEGRRQETLAAARAGAVPPAVDGGAADAWRVSGPDSPLPGSREPAGPGPVAGPAPSVPPAAPPPRDPGPAPTPPAHPPPVSGPASAGEQAVAWARTQLGKAYRWGGEGPDAYDCSGLTTRAWQRGGVSLPHSSRLQYQRVSRLDPSRLRPGDLIFWGSNPADPGSIHHVAIYAGGGMMIEAPNKRSLVREVPVRWSGTMPFVGRP